MISLLLATALGGELDELYARLGLDEAQQAELAKEGGLFRYDRAGLGLDADDASGSYEAGLSMTVIDGTPDEIWPHIEDCDAYVTYLPYVTGSTRSEHETTDAGATWTCAMELTTKGFVTRYAVSTEYERDAGLARFEMVEGSGNVLRSARGFWQTVAWPDNPDQTLLVYVFESRAAWWVPGFAKRMAAERGLSDITRLVGRQVERARPVAEDAPDRLPPSRPPAP
ncbi:MAG: hypothetical protein EP330_06135 [Deltaproteobacteria bacterium]|nr:MAG: hypothetical protein EP330_06135 [Deltaproteobacteria bacterium]